MSPPESQILIYQPEDGKTRIDVRLEDETVWLTQKQLSELFQVGIPTVNEHIQNIYKEGELEGEATIRNFRIVQVEGRREITREVATTTSKSLSLSGTVSVPTEAPAMTHLTF